MLYHDQMKHVEIIYFVTIYWFSRIDCEFVIVNEIKILKSLFCVVMANYSFLTQCLITVIWLRAHVALKMYSDSTETTVNIFRSTLLLLFYFVSAFFHGLQLCRKESADFKKIIPYLHCNKWCLSFLISYSVHSFAV